MKRGDFVAFAAIALCALLPLLLLLGQGAGGEAVARVDGRVVARLPLEKDGEVAIQSEYGFNLLRVAGGKAFIMEADCPGGDCLREGGIASPGRALCCLPHHLSVAIEGAAEPPFDALTE
ncbi:MAG: NusG domain II-containing protein [Christensenellaceae bacterium]|jgi:hypothetical protein|nr:NusG domain II-containing protein [Christensenellaceae bacterium]